ncbi:peptidase S24 [Flavobacteriaceae bacterium]|jgi:DNA polymerase V|nr:peptidase S24 [Flavobacteriaceae bacterium]MDA9283530.1 peptidase S24 [Flavobacteriaceae bacterium]MDB4175992.1 peptidase S24 [Flavobacteriaceae bacterium]MDC1435192.1 peptidase S24 [Flavobacteriaceae bacterium]
MEYLQAGKIKEQAPNHKASVSTQTGFPSPATHYLEPSIDLNKELIRHKDATFYVRVSGNEWAEFSMLDRDVLIIDRALTPKAGNLVLIVQQGAFKVIYFPVNNRSSSFIVWGTITYIIHYTL